MAEWISVKDRLPELNKLVLACNTVGDIEIVSYYNEKFMLYDGNEYPYEMRYITHWMPLPQPPKGG